MNLLLSFPMLLLFPTLGAAEWHVLQILMIITAVVVLYCFVVGEVTRNNSQVDKLWSLLPIVYVWIITWYGHFSPRLVIMAALVTLWGVRLTYNFALKGAYHWRFWSGVEDYRWQVLRANKLLQPHWKFMLFNLLFISLYQNVLILLFTLPAFEAYRYDQTPLGWLDCVAAGLMLFFIIYETVADVQQWRFQSKKWALIHSGKPLESLEEPYCKGFLTTGLWAHSRHPNYFAEQAIWLSFYVFSIAAGAPIFNWTLLGAVLLVLLFQGSSTFGESLSASKYPAYKDYKKNVSKFIPYLKCKKK